MARGTGSNLPVPAVTYAAPRGRSGGGLGHWLAGLLPWWGWVGLGIVFLATGGVAAVVAFFSLIADLGGRLIGEGALALMVVGIVWALAGLLLRMIPHGEAYSKGHHMVRNGAIGAVAGLAIILGGLNVAYGVGSLLFSDVMGGVRARVTLPAAPPALQVQFPTLTGATPPPAPTPRPS
jgi:hypothetical protein